MFGLKPRTKALLPRTEMPFGWLPEEFATMFHRLARTWPVLETAEWPFRYPMTTEEKEKEYVVRVELPGFAPEEVTVEMKGEMLTVTAEHKPKEAAAKKEPEAERTYVKRELMLPPEIELEKAEAVYRNGVLEVHLPRKAEAVGRRIAVKT